MPKNKVLIKIGVVLIGAIIVGGIFLLGGAGNGTVVGAVAGGGFVWLVVSL